MRLYESVIILNAQITEGELRGSLAKLEEIFKKHDAKMVNKVEWGRRQLGFNIQKQRDGFYLLIDFEADPKSLFEIQYAFRLADFILFSTVFVKGKQGQVQQKIPA